MDTLINFFPIIKKIHMTCAFLSITGYIWRGILILRGSSLLKARWLRITPHIIDTLLILSAGILAIILQQYPFVNSWLTAKTIGLIAYIVLGVIGLRYRRSKSIRMSAWLGAIIIFIYIMGVAHTHNPTWGLF